MGPPEAYCRAAALSGGSSEAGGSMLIKPQIPVVVIDARTCAWLERYAKLTSLRVQVRGTDRQISKQLEEVREAAMAWRSSATGTEEDTKPELTPQSEWLSTGKAADILHITDRAVRKAIAEDRLPATQIAGRYRISREDIQNELSRRKRMLKEKP